MKISDIISFPTTLGTGPNGGRFHESIFRSYQILEKVKDLLEKETPPSVVLEIIREVEDAPQLDKEI